MSVVVLVLATLAAVLHVAIFVMESLAWEHPTVRGIFGTSRADAATTAELAFNQGFYNLFLAITTFVGVGLVVADRDASGTALVVAGCASMLGAAIVLVSRSTGRARGALVQGTIPALALLALLLA